MGTRRRRVGEEWRPRDEGWGRACEKGLSGPHAEAAPRLRRRTGRQAVQGRAWGGGIPFLSPQGTLGPRHARSLPTPARGVPEAAGSAPAPGAPPRSLRGATSPRSPGAAAAANNASTPAPAATSDWLPGAGLRPQGLQELRSYWSGGWFGRMRTLWLWVGSAEGGVRVRGLWVAEY